MLDSIPSEKRKCHRCNFEKSCRDLVMTGACERWSKISGSNPQTGEPLDKWACIDDLQHILLLEIGNQTSKVSAELNVLRNESAKAHSEQMTIGSVAAQRARDAVKDAVADAVTPLIGAVRESLEETVRVIASNHEPQKLIGPN